MVPIAGVTGPTLMSDAPTTLPGQLSDADMRRIWREKFGDYDEQKAVVFSRDAVRVGLSKWWTKMTPEMMEAILAHIEAAQRDV